MDILIFRMLGLYETFSFLVATGNQIVLFEEMKKRYG